MKVEDMTRADFVKALSEIEQLETTAVLPAGIVREVANNLIGCKGNIDIAIKNICRQAMTMCFTKYKPIMVMDEFQNWKEKLCCGNCKKPFYFEKAEKFCPNCGAESDCE